MIAGIAGIFFPYLIPPTSNTRPQVIVVDVQNDFIPGGSLPAKGGDEILPCIFDYIKQSAQKGIPVYATRDWHPMNHCSFQAQGGRWYIHCPYTHPDYFRPVHCVEQSVGADFPPDFPKESIEKIVSKGTLTDKDAYRYPAHVSDTAVDLTERI